MLVGGVGGIDGCYSDGGNDGVHVLGGGIGEG